VYVNNWCGADGEPVDGPSSTGGDCNTLPHYQRYQRCLHQQQASCLGHYGHATAAAAAGQRVLYETVGRAGDARGMLCSRHGRSNSLSPGRARYAAGQLCSAARLRRPLMPPAADGDVASAEAAVAAVAGDGEERATASPSRPDDAAQSASSTVDDPAADADSGGVCDAAAAVVDNANRNAATAVAEGVVAPAEERATTSDDVEQSTSSTVDDPAADASNADVSEVAAAAESDNIDGRPEEAEIPDNADADTEHQRQPADTERPSDTVADLVELPAGAEKRTQQIGKDGGAVDAKTDPEVENAEECDDSGGAIQKEAEITEDDHRRDVTTDVVDGDHGDVTADVMDGDSSAGGLAERGQRVEELASKDLAELSSSELANGDWTSDSPVIRLDQASAKFDSSALEKILSSLSATSRRDRDELATDDDNARRTHDKLTTGNDDEQRSRDGLTTHDDDKDAASGRHRRRDRRTTNSDDAQRSHDELTTHDNSSRRDHDGLGTTADRDAAAAAADDVDVPDEVWMRRDVQVVADCRDDVVADCRDEVVADCRDNNVADCRDDVVADCRDEVVADCRSSLSMLDAATAQLVDDALPFKSHHRRRRRRSSDGL